MYQEEEETVIYQQSNRSSLDRNQKDSAAKQNFAESGGTGTSIDLPCISNQLNFIMGIHSPRNLKILDEN
jgi:hypothetical protein